MRQTRSLVVAEDLLANPGWLRALAGRLVNDEVEVDDLVHEAWVALLRKPGSEVRNLPSWLSGVLNNMSRRRLRHVGRHVELDSQRASQLEDAAPSPAESMDLIKVRERVAEAVLELDEPFRSTVLEAYFAGLSPSQIAERDGIPAATVRTRLNRGIERLRDRLGARREAQAPLWAGVCLLAPPPAVPPPGSSSAHPFAPLAGVGLAAGICALFGLAAWFAMGGADLSSIEVERSRLESAAAEQEGPGSSEEQLVDARPQVLEEAAIEGDGLGSKDEKGSGCSGLDDPLGLPLVPLFEDGTVIPQPSQDVALDSGTGEESSGGIGGLARRDAKLTPDRLEHESSEPQLGAAYALPSPVSSASSSPAGRGASALSSGVPSMSGRQSGSLAFAGSSRDEEDDDEDDEDGRRDPEGLPGGISMNQGTGAIGGGGLGAAEEPDFGIEKNLLLTMEELCPCLQRIGVGRWLAIQALVESGRVDPRSLPDPCALCDVPVRGELWGVVEGVGAIVMIRREPSVSADSDELRPLDPQAARLPLPFIADDVLFVSEGRLAAPEKTR